MWIIHRGTNSRVLPAGFTRVWVVDNTYVKGQAILYNVDRWMVKFGANSTRSKILSGFYIALNSLVQYFSVNLTSWNPYSKYGGRQGVDS